MSCSIYIVFSPDENYAVHAGVAMQSILHHAKAPSRFTFHFLEVNKKLTQATKDKLAQIANNFQVPLYFTQVKSELAEVYSQWGPDYISTAAYSRLWLAEALPQLDRCLYLDSDLLALDSIEELWDTPIPATAVAAVADCYVDRENLKKYQEIHRYFNSGVLLMDLQIWRKRQYVQKCLDLADNPELHKRFADQDVLNIALSNDVYFLHPRWNIQTGQRPPCVNRSLEKEWRQWREICQSPKIAHFTSERKPWDMAMKHRWSMEYWKMLTATPWAAEIHGLKWKIALARMYRIKAQITKVLRWLLTIRSNRTHATLKVSVCGRMIINRQKTPPPSLIHPHFAEDKPVSSIKSTAEECTIAAPMELRNDS
jgi:lipopolysaccharide biosynthesis glycosyltransferase